MTEGLKDMTVPLRVAVMGCVVNGPGEAREADLGVASGNGKGQIFVKGQVIKTVPESEIVATLIEEANRLAAELGPDAADRHRTGRHGLTQLGLVELPALPGRRGAGDPPHGSAVSPRSHDPPSVCRQSAGPGQSPGWTPPRGDPLRRYGQWPRQPSRRGCKAPSAAEPTPSAAASSSSSTRASSAGSTPRREPPTRSARASQSSKTSRSRPTAATYYLSERGGTIYAVAAPDGFEQASAPVLASGLGAVHQLAVTADGKTLYAIEYGPSGSLLSIDTASGAVTTVASGFQQAVGLALGQGEATAFITEQALGGRVVAVPTAGGATAVIATGIAAPFFLTWADAVRQTLLVTQRDPIHTLTVIQLGFGAPIVSTVTTTPFRPSSVALWDDAGTPTGVIAADSEIATVDLTAALQPPVMIDMPTDPMFPGGYRRVFYRLAAGLTPDDIEFFVGEGPEAGRDLAVEGRHLGRREPARDAARGTAHRNLHPRRHARRDGRHTRQGAVRCVDGMGG